MTTKLLITQYYKVISKDEHYSIARQKEIDECLVLNLKNPFIDGVHLLNEELYDLSFVPEMYRNKLKQISIGIRLTYKAAIDYYNAEIPNTLCILANADIFTDESIEILDHISFEQSVLALNRYEYNDETSAALMNGLEVNRHCTPLVADYAPSIWTQDAWIWKTPHLTIENVDFRLGTTGCDNHFAYVLHNAGFRVYNPSHILSINHYDRLSSIVDKDGILKGAISRDRDPPSSLYQDKKVFLKNTDECIDIYTLSASTVSTKGAHPKIAMLKYLQNSKSILELAFSVEHDAARFSNPRYWSFTPTIPYLELTFDKVYRLGILDIQGKPCSRNDKTYGYITKFNLTYCGADNIWKDYPTMLNGIPRQNGNFIKRNYLTMPIYCNKIRIYCVESNGIPALKVRAYGHSIQTHPVQIFTMTAFNAEWQRPVITEYSVFKQLHAKQSLSYNYFAFPWATLIDEIWMKKTSLKTILSEYNPKGQGYCTVVQHILFKQLFYSFNKLKICYVFTPHCTLADIETAKKYGIKLFGFPLYATVKRGIDEPVVPIQSRKYLTSFIGQYDPKWYLTDIRLKIFDLFASYADCLIKRRGEWHFQGMVYKGEAGTNDVLEKEYKMALAQSKFSLCPSGSGPNSIRIWESMSYGSVPVILADTLVMPTIRTMAWTDAVIFWKESDIDGLYNYLKSITVKEMEAKSKACLTLFETYFSDNFISRVLVEEMEANIQHV